MTACPSGPAEVEAYIAGFPPAVREALEAVRAAIRGAAPEAGEKIGYGIPTFTLHGNLVHYAAYSGHIGFYPGSGALVAFADELGVFELGRGTIQFPLDRPLPLDLIDRIVRWCVRENRQRQARRRAPRASGAGALSGAQEQTADPCKG